MLHNLDIKSNIYTAVLDYLYSSNKPNLRDYSHCLILTPNYSFSYSLKKQFNQTIIIPKILSYNRVFENFALEKGYFEYINFSAKALLQLYKFLKEERHSSINEAALLFENSQRDEKNYSSFISENIKEKFDYPAKYREFQKLALDQTLNKYEQVIVAGIYITDEFSKYVYEKSITCNYPIFIQGLAVDYQAEPDHFLYQTLSFYKENRVEMITLYGSEEDTQAGREALDSNFFPETDCRVGTRAVYELQLCETINEYYQLRTAVKYLSELFPEVALVTANQVLLKKVQAELQKRNISLFFPEKYIIHPDGMFALNLLDVAILGGTDESIIALLKHPYIYEQNASIIDEIEKSFIRTIKTISLKGESHSFLRMIQRWAKGVHLAKNFAEYHIKWIDSLTSRLTLEGRRILEFIKIQLPNLDDIYEYKEVLTFFLKKHYFYHDEKTEHSIEVFSPREALFLPHKSIVLLDCTEESFPATDASVMLNLFQLINTKKSVAIYNKEKPLSRLFLKVQYSSGTKKEIKEVSTIAIERSTAKKARFVVPVEMLPKRFSPTMLELLINNPYKFYVRYILGIKETNSVGIKPSYREFGYVLHKVFQKASNNSFARDEYSHLLEEELKKYTLQYPYVRNLWLPRGLKILEHFAIFHNDRLSEIKTLENEKEVSIPLQNGVELFCRFDRVELLKDGTAAIVEFKTGTLATFKEVIQLIKPQLPFQGLILQESQHVEIKEMLYCKPSADKVTLKKLPNPIEIIEMSRHKLEKLLELYLSGEFNFLEENSIL